MTPGNFHMNMYDPWDTGRAQCPKTLRACKRTGSYSSPWHTGHFTCLERIQQCCHDPKYSTLCDFGKVFHPVNYVNCVFFCDYTKEEKKAITARLENIFFKCVLH